MFFKLWKDNTTLNLRIPVIWSTVMSIWIIKYKIFCKYTYKYKYQFQLVD